MFQKLIKSFSFAIDGLKEAVKGHSFRVMLFIVVITICLGFLLKISLFEWIMIILSMGLVLTLEIINTAWERSFDYLRPEINPIVKIAKDLVAAAVFLASLTALIAGILIFLPKILEIF
ncbi:MAG: diacylglycerol kinase family protein [Patescibacteria group bacterium]|jgi:diacylglycerol kinase|nr:diacylglycerol kinase family protein [Patescibacteria group bacterium]